MTGERGDSALMIAAYNGRPEIVRLLLDSGADVSLRNDDGETALDIARRRLAWAADPGTERNLKRGLITPSEAGDRKGLGAVILLLDHAKGTKPGGQPL